MEGLVVLHSARPRWLQLVASVEQKELVQQGLGPVLKRRRRLGRRRQTRRWGTRRAGCLCRPLRRRQRRGWLRALAWRRRGKEVPHKIGDEVVEDQLVCQEAAFLPLPCLHSVQGFELKRRHRSAGGAEGGDALWDGQGRRLQWTERPFLIPSGVPQRCSKGKLRLGRNLGLPIFIRTRSQLSTPLREKVRNRHVWQTVLSLWARRGVGGKLQRLGREDVPKRR
mmetsp:Transcript_6203/g.14131  ORF Transcript_6203/g.14131 Transcript_6203/m.14131 type:complete len:224 (-) Transcript_6203:1745-2416(-)